MLRACVQSLVAIEAEALRIGRIVVVDNASDDDSTDGLPIDARIAVIQNASNRGFAAACNQGAAGSRADYVLFLNPDTRVAVSSLEIPTAFLEDPAHEDVGIAGIQMVDERGAPVPSNRRFPDLRIVFGEITRLNRVWPSSFPRWLLPLAGGSEPVEVDQVSGAFFLVRRPLFDALGGFDERFFVYYEEVDFARRARQAGFRTIFLPAASAFHRGGYSSDQVRTARLFYSLRSRLLYARKHWTPVERLTLGLLTFTVEPAARLCLSIARASAADFGATLVAFPRLAAWLIADAVQTRAR